MFVCWLLIRVRYHWTQILVSLCVAGCSLELIFHQGVFVCVAGLILLVASDVATNKNGAAHRRGEGDGFMVAAATLYGTGMVLPSSLDFYLTWVKANALEEVFVRKSPIYEVCVLLDRILSVILAPPRRFLAKWACGA